MIQNADPNRTGLLKSIYFFKILKDFKVDISDQDQRTIIAFYDPEETGELPYQEVVRDFVGGISDARIELSDLAWKHIDKKNAGAVHV